MNNQGNSIIPAYLLSKIKTPDTLERLKKNLLIDFRGYPGTPRTVPGREPGPGEGLLKPSQPN